MTQLDPKALEAAIGAYDVQGWGQRLWTPSAAMERAITAYLAALPPPAEAGELVAQLRADAVTALHHPSWEPSPEQIYARYTEAADLIQSLSLRLETVTRERFLPLGDNHHNALLCPYCNPDRFNPKAAEARITALEAALKPFADFAAKIAVDHPGWDHDEFYMDRSLTMAPFRAARAALKEPS